MVNNPKDTQGSTVSVAPQKDGALLFRAKNGNSEALHELITRYTPLVEKLSRSILGVPEEEREDLVQEGLIGLHKAILFYNPSVSSFSTFAYLCVRRNMLSALKAINRRIDTVSFDALDYEAVSPAPEPEEAAIDRENCEVWLRRFEEVLSEYESRVLALILSGKEPADAAQLLEKSEKSVRNALTRARTKLSSLLS